MEKIRIVSRNSNLALWQANFVKEQLHTHYPNLFIEVSGITTRGDQILDKSLDKIGGKGLFIKELENVLLNGAADIAVHSLKDLPAKLHPTFSLGAILKREDAADAFVSNKYQSLNAMPKDAIIGTSSARRVAIIKQDYPHLRIKLLRGNIQTRLTKLDNNEYDGIILAVAGLKRLNLDYRITQGLETNQFLPAIGQGALAVEILSSRLDLVKFLQPLNDVNTVLEVSMERELGGRLGANCSVPIAIYAKSIGDQIRIEAKIWDSENDYCCKASVQVNQNRYGDGVNLCLSDLLKQGVYQVLEKYK